MKERKHNSKSRFSKIRAILFIIGLAFFSYHKTFSQQGQMIIRISEIEIYPESIAEYNAILKEEAEVSVKLEPGVLAIFPMYQKEDSTQIRILEMYRSREAYLSHLKTPHFLKYKTGTMKMVKSLKLIDMQVIDPESMDMIFQKMND